MMSFRIKVAALLCATLLCACASNPKSSTDNNSATAMARGALPPPDSTAVTGAYNGVSEYHIGSQDLLEISVFQVKELDRAVRVNSGGQISLPLIGIVQAGGKTVQELETEIANKLTNGYLQSPQVSVFVKEFTSQRVTLEGAVKKPGIYPLTGKTSLLQAIAMAEGTDPLANLEGVVVFRVVDGKKMAAVFDLKQIRSGKVEDPQIYGDDVVVIDQSGSKTMLRRIVETVPILNVFRYY